MSIRRILLFVSLTLIVTASIQTATHAETVLVRGATVWTQGPDGTLEDADLLVVDGRIKKVGRGLQQSSRKAGPLTRASRAVKPKVQ